jgi:aminopeptidase N
VDQWFALNAMVPSPATAAAVRELTKHPEFKLTNPNRVRGLLTTFTLSNPVAFHAPDGGGYRLLADMVLDVDPLNPQVAARIATGFGSWRGLEAGRRELSRAELTRILAAPKLSRDTFEIVSKTLGNGG